MARIRQEPYQRTGLPGLDATVRHGPGSAHLPDGHFSVCQVATLGTKCLGYTLAEVGRACGHGSGLS